MIKVMVCVAGGGGLGRPTRDVQFARGNAYAPRASGGGKTCVGQARGLGDRQRGARAQICVG